MVLAKVIRPNNSVGGGVNHGEMEKARRMLGGVLAEAVRGPTVAANALTARPPNAPIAAGEFRLLLNTIVKTMKMLLTVTDLAAIALNHTRLTVKAHSKPFGPILITVLHTISGTIETNSLI